MKTQISRDTYRPEKRYSGVYQQQGRLVTDADWNALSEIVKRRLDEALADVIGSGAPRGRGFGIVQSDSGLVFGGRLYAGGVPARVVPARPGEPPSYGNQADFPAPPPLPEDTGFVLYADVWERAVVSLEDTGAWISDHLRDPALHGADTTTRTQTMAQVKWCSSFPGPEDLEANLPIGDSLLTVALRESQVGRDPCDPCAAEVAISQRVGNYLFRLEVHDVVGVPSTSPTGVTLKWSSENGAEQHRVGTEPPEFKVGDYVYEFHNEETEKHLGVHLVSGFTPARGQLHEIYPETPPAGFDRVRRWDGYAVLDRSAGGSWSLVTSRSDVVEVDEGLGGGHLNLWRLRKPPPAALGRDRDVQLRSLADGVDPGDVRLASDEVVFHLRSLAFTLQTRSLVAGDYWLAPVRESIHRADDPDARTVLSAAPPVGILHHYLRLADVGADGSIQPPTTDREQRLSFPPLTDLKALDVDYQPACPAGLFKDTSGGPIDTVKKALDRLCTLSAADIAFEKPCNTSLFAGVPARTLRTVADALRLLCDIEARHVEYAPPADCSLLKGSATVEQALNRVCAITAADVPYAGSCAKLDPNINTVKGALDAICDRPSGRGCRVTVGMGGEFETLADAVTSLLNDGKRDLSFCLLPGDHRLDTDLTVSGAGQALQFALSGSGRGSRLTITPGGRLELDAVRSVRIEHLLLKIERLAQTGGPSPTDEPVPTDRLTRTARPAQLVVRNGLEVTLEGIIVIGPAIRPGDAAPVVLHARTSVRVATSRFNFPNDEGRTVVTNVFAPLNPAVAELFSPQLDDERFEAQREIVARTLVGLPARPRATFVRGLSAAIEQLPVPLAEPLRRSLKDFVALVTSPAPEFSAVIKILDDVRVVATRALPSLALVLEPAAGDATLVDNQIQGIVSVYGAPEKGGNLTVPQLESLAILIVRLSGETTRTPIRFIPAAGRLFVARNGISRLTIAGALERRLGELVDRPTDRPTEPTITGIYRAAYVSQNHFTAGGNRVLAKDMRLTDNLFEPVETDLGAAIADTANYAGNGAVENDSFLFFNVTRRHNDKTRDDLNTMVIR